MCLSHRAQILLTRYRPRGPGEAVSADVANTLMSLQGAQASAQGSSAGQQQIDPFLRIDSDMPGNAEADNKGNK